MASEVDNDEVFDEEELADGFDEEIVSEEELEEVVEEIDDDEADDVDDVVVVDLGLKTKTSSRPRGGGGRR